MKNQAIAAILMAAFAAPAFADNFETQVFNHTPEQQVQVEELSQKEMKETEGAFTLPELSVTQSMMTGGALNTGFYYAGADNPTLKGAVLAASVGSVTSGTAAAAFNAGAYNASAANLLANQLFQWANRNTEFLDSL